MKINKYFDFTTSLDIKTRAKLIKETGFDGVFLYYDDALTLEEEVKELKKNNLYIETVHLPATNCNHLWLDSKEGEDFVLKTKEGIIQTALYNIETVILHISSKDNPPAFNDLGLKRLREILDLCEKLNVNLALENLRRLDYLDYIYNNLSSPKLKFCFDSGHANAFTKNIDNFLFDKYGSKLIAIHLNDNFGDYDSHMIPFKGSINFELLASKLKALDFKGPITSEAILKEKDPSLFLKETKDALDKIKTMME